MRINTAVIMIFLFLGVISLSGCGSIYICANTHTHFYGNENIETDEAEIDGFAKYVKFFKERMNAEPEPLEGFKWTDKTNKKEEDNGPF
jgi:hypothetical protein